MWPFRQKVQGAHAPWVSTHWLIPLHPSPLVPFPGSTHLGPPHLVQPLYGTDEESRVQRILNDLPKVTQSDKSRAGTRIRLSFPRHPHSLELQLWEKLSSIWSSFSNDISSEVILIINHRCNLTKTSKLWYWYRREGLGKSTTRRYRAFWGI